MSWVSTAVRSLDPCKGDGVCHCEPFDPVFLRGDSVLNNYPSPGSPEFARAEASFVAEERAYLEKLKAEGKVDWSDSVCYGLKSTMMLYGEMVWAHHFERPWEHVDG